MITRFKLKKDAEAFCRELEDIHGVGVYHHIYKGHRLYCVQHNDESNINIHSDTDIFAEKDGIFDI